MVGWSDYSFWSSVREVYDQYRKYEEFEGADVPHHRFAGHGNSGVLLLARSSNRDGADQD
jgi:hypothetical protein